VAKTGGRRTAVLSTLLHQDCVTVPWQSGHLWTLPADDVAWRVACAASEGTWPRLRGQVQRPVARPRVVEGDVDSVGVVSSNVCITSIVSRRAPSSAVSGPSRQPKRSTAWRFEPGLPMASSTRLKRLCVVVGRQRGEMPVPSAPRSAMHPWLGLGGRTHRSHLTAPQASCARQLRKPSALLHNRTCKRHRRTAPACICRLA
jgi:hypothetical protein